MSKPVNPKVPAAATGAGFFGALGLALAYWLGVPDPWANVVALGFVLAGGFVAGWLKSYEPTEVRQLLDAPEVAAALGSLEARVLAATQPLTVRKTAAKKTPPKP